jgi:hypothetical protein
VNRSLTSLRPSIVITPVLTVTLVLGGSILRVVGGGDSVSGYGGGGREEGGVKTE